MRISYPCHLFFSINYLFPCSPPCSTRKTVHRCHWYDKIQANLKAHHPTSKATLGYLISHFSQYVNLSLIKTKLSITLKTTNGKVPKKGSRCNETNWMRLKQQNHFNSMIYGLANTLTPAHQSMIHTSSSHNNSATTLLILLYIFLDTGRIRTKQIA
jgi:hypothetical protein